MPPCGAPPGRPIGWGHRPFLTGGGRGRDSIAALEVAPRASGRVRGGGVTGGRSHEPNSLGLDKRQSDFPVCLQLEHGRLRPSRCPVSSHAHLGAEKEQTGATTASRHAPVRSAVAAHPPLVAVLTSDRAALPLRFRARRGSGSGQWRRGDSSECGHNIGRAVTCPALVPRPPPRRACIACAPPP